MPATTPYGSWTSPISAADLTTNGHPVSGPRWVGDEVWWLELRPQEDGRSAVRRRDASGAVVDVLPAPWNAASRVHEYGGGAWAADDRGVLVFVEFTDQRLYVLEPGSREPRPLTPLGTDGTHHRYGDVSLRGDEVVAVRETHTPSATKTGENTTDIVRDVVAVPLDGSAATDPAAVRSVVGGSDFLAAPRWSPNGRHLVWIAWDHPRMPWDGTELRVAPVDDDGVAGPWRTLAGSPTESVLQPEWLDDDTLVAIADPTGWWNLERITLDGVRTPLHPDAAEYGGPLWRLGTRWYTLLPDGRLLATRTFGSTSLVVLDPSGERDPEPIETPWTSIAVGGARDGRVLVTSGASTVGAGARVLDLATGAAEDVRLDADDLPDARYLPVAERREFPGERTVHAIVYPPRNPDHVAPQGELPPYVAVVHGGPTSQAVAALDMRIAYWTSRGIGVVDIDYGGSTGYGRAYRETLRGQWGVVDVEDTIAAVRGLGEAGLADPARLAIRGGSAGGWTVLSALTRSDVFAAGVSYFGVAELERFAQDTHDFESRYLDGLIGPLPEAAALYRERAPLHAVDQLRTPVLLLQGLDDRVVPPSQAELFRDAMRERGIPHAYVTYAGEGHGFRKAATIIDATEKELAFYGQILGFATPGVPALPLD
ncbi:prolyl oligopeptidase family serine peptidase [Curtobacterium sp. MCBD17_035]|uniref:dipeptidyl-peptidase 5 n=1 Tax=Curtobacterium sp. MCBD17_035 TaxID=2175673 RepID=UPI000DA85692|nr:prolyl oligopeptidase family serine peptidase [Curtobacterium sp. MCBD17_035]WIB67028.1 prolyl oligopeptidase family serine peptidase [Curtobacterium sp. MCBD17_035]